MDFKKVRNSSWVETIRKFDFCIREKEKRKKKVCKNYFFKSRKKKMMLKKKKALSTLKTLKKSFEIDHRGLWPRYHVFLLSSFLNINHLFDYNTCAHENCVQI